MLHELQLAISLLGQDRFAEAYKAMARISRIQSVMTLSWDVLSTLTPVDYLKFRSVLGTSSGFQSVQFREIEFRSASRSRTSSIIIPRAARSGRSLSGRWPSRACAKRPDAPERAGFDLKDRRGGRRGRWLQVYRDADRWFDLYGLAEKLVDIDDALAGWRTSMC